MRREPSDVQPRAKGRCRTLGVSRFSTDLTGQTPRLAIERVDAVHLLHLLEASRYRQFADEAQRCRRDGPRAIEGYAAERASHMKVIVIAKLLHRFELVWTGTTHVTMAAQHRRCAAERTEWSEHRSASGLQWVGRPSRWPACCGMARDSCAR